MISYDVFQPFRKKKTMETRLIKKKFPIKRKEDVEVSKPKEHVNKVRWDPKSLPYNPT